MFGFELSSSFPVFYSGLYIIDIALVTWKTQGGLGSHMDQTIQKQDHFKDKKVF